MPYSGARIDRGEERDHDDEHDTLESRDRDAGRNQQLRTRKQQRAQLVARGEEVMPILRS